ncbi:acyloxyacyl hydrolase [Urechidicola croceus]|uniref:Deacylase n=1 Tax=Urechidicola croceus TaxID=1850246 RepID=A0A1D8P7K7_9FLAO|nr:acyloxyacyl hydrolase [Urechidicola croceus]AOW20532.1 hypothetical protein LPB138_07510 [Urechidicola croceus]
MRIKLNILFIFSCIFSFAQDNQKSSYLELDYFYGNIIEHAPELKPIIQSHPSGLILSWNKKRLNNTKFDNTYNFPDFGFSVSYHDFKTEILGEVYSAYAHYNFYLTNRNSVNQIKLTSAFGLGYATSPFDKQTNSKNWALGSKFMASAYLKLNYQREYLLDKIGVNAGVALIHYSNTSFKAPNLGINTLALSIGANYNLDSKITAPERIKGTVSEKNPIQYYVLLRGGFNESLVNGSGVFPFYTLSFFADKKLNYKSRVSIGTDIFFSHFMKDYIEFNNLVEETPNDTADWKRVGLYIGHELNFEQFSLLTQVGYHVYAPYKYVSGIYERFGFRKRFNNHLFADLSLKINLFRAEGLEFGVGYRF